MNLLRASETLQNKQLIHSAQNNLIDISGHFILESYFNKERLLISNQCFLRPYQRRLLTDLSLLFYRTAGIDRYFTFFNFAVFSHYVQLFCGLPFTSWRPANKLVQVYVDQGCQLFFTRNKLYLGLRRILNSIVKKLTVFYLFNV